MPIPAFVIDQPAPPTPRRGLFDAATGPMPMPRHAETSGLQWWSEVCAGAHLYPPACLTPPYQAFTYDSADGLVNAYPFVVYASEVCGPVGAEAAEARRRVQMRLQLGQQQAVEKALWGGGEGVTGIFETLQAAGKVTTVGPATTVVGGVAVLEQQAATNGYDGPLILHARPFMSAYLGSGGLIRDPRPADGQRLYTWHGSEIVFGAGYSGNSPVGVAPTATAETMYLTGRVLLWQESEVFVSPPDQVLDRATNQRGVFASRAYAIGIECLAAAVVTTHPAI